MLCQSDILIFLFVVTFIPVRMSDGCNESICASIVSKCSLLKSCDCEIEPTGCSCCKQCFACLDHLQIDCCSCVELCPSPNRTFMVLPGNKSVVADFETSVPELWEALTTGDDHTQDRWQTYTFPADSRQRALKKIKENQNNNPDQVVVAETTSPENCTVAFLSQCMAEYKCEISCKTMGARAYRWFSDGCCECIGDTCHDYGINESRCEDCSYEDVDDKLVLDSISDDELERLERLEGIHAEEHVDDVQTEPKAKKKHKHPKNV